MDWMKRFSRRSFWWILFWNTLLCAGLTAPFAIGLNQLEYVLNEVIQNQSGSDVPSGVFVFFNTTETFLLFGALGVFIIALIFSLFLWLTLRGSLKKLVAASVEEEPKEEDKAKAEEDQKSARQKAMDDQRRALLLFSMLQREGRLMDFLAEDLSLYEDDQIGAAARGVQESCKKLIEKHFNPGPVLDKEEGEQVTVEDNFDPASIKLIGNVSGNPPFTGVLRHRGWKAGRFELPSLIAQGDPRLISPAEVELE